MINVFGDAIGAGIINHVCKDDLDALGSLDNELERKKSVRSRTSINGDLDNNN